MKGLFVYSSGSRAGRSGAGELVHATVTMMERKEGVRR